MWGLEEDEKGPSLMTSPGAERYLSATLLNKSAQERLCDVDAMLDAIGDYAIAQLDVDGNVVRWCPGAHALTGYSAADILDRPMSTFYLEEDRRAGMPERELSAARESGRLEFEGWRLRKDGRRFRAGVLLGSIHAETGEVTGFTQLFRDLTAEHQRAETMFHGLLESAPDAMVIVASDGRIMLANARTDQMFGYSREELIGCTVEVLIPPQFRGDHERHRADFFAELVPRQMGVGLQLWGQRRDGSEFPIEVSLSPLRTDQGVLVSAAIRDVTEQLALRSQLADARAETEVFAERERIAGDLQDHALQRVFAVGLALEGTIPRARSPEVQQRLSAAVDDLHGVVQDFRNAIFGLRVGPSDTPGLRQRLDDVINELSQDLATTVQYKGPLSVVEPALAEHAEAVLKEAIGNAVKHSGASRLIVAIDVADDLRIDVADNGRGIPDHVVGTGLSGLRKRAEAAGGTLSVRADPGGGTRLRWTVPLP
ncbi:PAS domain-containing sensor histidine kinase [Mycobacterium shigaense]|uniref:PAS domain-containing sensor histidine kinase n=2 Tax=Mycobacterium shigaense TaxID=722731 RepID=UPI002ADFFFF0|nr:PAS domain S-box protein [Mycobacterium shigaense]MEA1124026.1 PAS domain S-box protein [Mycobacterium shigaense]